MSESTLNAALVAALAELSNPHKDRKANIKPGYSYSYADLAKVLDHVRPVLAKHGLAVTQDITEADGGRLAVSTTIHHQDGGRITFGPLVGDAGREWQSIGSAVTYARRYALTAALGIAGDDDDDANAVTPRAPHAEPERKNATASTLAAIADLMRHASTLEALEGARNKARALNLTKQQETSLRNVYQARANELQATS